VEQLTYGVLSKRSRTEIPYAKFASSLKAESGSRRTARLELALSSPEAPYYDVKLPMYLICGSYCPSGRDAYFAMVEKAKSESRLSHTTQKSRTFPIPVFRGFTLLGPMKNSKIRKI